MRIAYGVHGYGRGHASRALALLPKLRERHEVLVLAGGDAYELLRADHPIQRIPTLRYVYGPNACCCHLKTLVRNLPAAIDVMVGGPCLENTCDILKSFAPHVAISDAEFLTHRAAAELGIPRIGFDHFGLIAYCRFQANWLDRPKLCVDGWTYRWLVRRPERIVVSSFYPAQAWYPGVRVVGPVLREAVRTTAPIDGDHLLVYLNQARHQFTPQLAAALTTAGCPVRIYGLGQRKAEGNLSFRPTSNLPFVEDLAHCRALLCTAGNQLVGEALYLGKPVLVMPEDTVEQRLNAAAVCRLGVGECVAARRLDPEAIQGFLERLHQYRIRIRRVVAEGWIDPYGVLEESLAELKREVQPDPTLAEKDA